MYLPKYAAVDNFDFLKDFITSHSFGSLVTSSSNGLSANHYPFLLITEDKKTFLYTHIARSNPQWKEVANECLVIFSGPHAYMSPTYYVTKLNVPTWNYTAVHAYCNAEVISDMNFEKELMKKLVHLYEEKNHTKWNYELTEDFHEKLLKAIVWIKLEVVKLEGKFKLSQNRDQIDYESVIKNLTEKSSDNNKELLWYMDLTNPFGKD
jgi:transcriptional regulator